MKLKKDIETKYVWLESHYMTNLIAIGLAFLVTNTGWLFINAVSIYQEQSHVAILNTRSAYGQACHWIEFICNCIPIIVILVKYPVQDMFAEFNKFPEQITRVSIMQYPQQTHLQSQIGEKSSLNKDIFGVPVNLTYNAIDNDLILAE